MELTVNKREINNIISDIDSHLDFIIDGIFVKIKYLIQSDLRLKSGDLLQLIIVVMETVQQYNKKLKNKLTQENIQSLVDKVLEKSVDFVENQYHVFSNETYKLIDKLTKPFTSILWAANTLPTQRSISLNTGGMQVNTVDIYNKLYTRMTDLIKTGKLAVQDEEFMQKLVINIFAFIKKFKNLDMEERKFLVYETIKNTVNNLKTLVPDIDEERFNIYKQMIQFLPGLVEKVEEVVNGKYDLSKINFEYIIDNLDDIFTEENINKFKSCFPFLFKKK